VKYLSAEQVLFIHSRLIDTTGGLHGVRDTGLLQSAVERPKATFEGKDLYKDVFRKTAALMESLTNNHPFIDGNKRTAVTSSTLFLQFNGHLLNTSQKKLEKFALQMATDKASFQDAVEWFKKNSDKI
jgi:death-on-curing protein